VVKPKDSKLTPPALSVAGERDIELGFSDFVFLSDLSLRPVLQQFQIGTQEKDHAMKDGQHYAHLELHHTHTLKVSDQKAAFNQTLISGECFVTTSFSDWPFLSLFPLLTQQLVLWLSVSVRENWNLRIVT